MLEQKLPERKTGENKSKIDLSLVSSSIKVDNVETEGTSTVSSILRACDTDV